MEKLSKEDMKKYFEDEIKRKDDIIKELEEKNIMYIRMSIKQADENQKLGEQMKQLKDANSKLQVHLHTAKKK